MEIIYNIYMCVCVCHSLNDTITITTPLTVKLVNFGMEPVGVCFEAGYFCLTLTSENKRDETCLWL